MRSETDISNLKAVLFDLGGTLIRPVGEPSMRVWHSFRDKLSDGDPEMSFDSFHEMNKRYWKRMQDEYYSMTEPIEISKYNAAFLMNEGFSERSANRLATFLSDMTFEYELESTHLMPSAKELIEWLRESGFKTGVISNASHSESRMRALMSKVAIEHLFDVVVISSSVGVQKPNPEIFKIALSQLHIRPIDALYVGDRMDYDAIGAQNAGLHWILLDSDTSLCDVRAIIEDATS